MMYMLVYKYKGEVDVIHVQNQPLHKASVLALLLASSVFPEDARLLQVANIMSASSMK